MARTSEQLLAEIMLGDSEWRALDEAAWRGAPRRVAYMNRLQDRISALLAELRSLPDWPTVRERMATSPDPETRLRAALELALDDLGRALDLLDELQTGSYGGVSHDARWARAGLMERPAPLAPVPSPAPAHPSTFDPAREALAEAVLAVHGAIMGGGFISAVDITGDRIDDAVTGFEGIGVPEAAALLRRAKALFPGGSIPADAIERQRMVDTVIDSAAIEALDAPYAALFPTDASLGDRIDTYLDRPSG